MTALTLAPAPFLPFALVAAAPAGASSGGAASRFGPLDWSIVALYMLSMLALGLYFARRQKTTDEYFLAGRRMPVWAVAVSIVATSVSAATFIGLPEDSYNGNLTYFALSLAGLIAVVIVAVFFIPAFYRHNVTTVYELLEHRFGPRARRSASAAFMIGRVFASGARLFIAAIPLSLVLFGDLSSPHLILSILIVAGIATIYTVLGGLDAVIWTEAPQTLLFVAAALIAAWLLLRAIPLDTAQIFSALADSTAADGSPKLTVFDTRVNPSAPFSLWSTILGLTLFNIAVYGTDQDLAQRILTCKSALKGSWSAILSNFIGLAVAALFLTIGLLLYIFYKRPDLMGDAAPAYAVDDSRKVFLSFILHETPTGLRGLMIAGVFATAMSSLASALNAMASTIVCDFYKPLRPGRTERHYVRASRFAVFAWGALLAAFACLCTRWQPESGAGLVPFAIGVMTFAYTGLLAVFLAAIFTRRGNTTTVAAALIVGFASVALMQSLPTLAARLSTHNLWPFAPPPTLSPGWQMLIGATLAFLTCIAGKSRPKSANSRAHAN